MRLTEDLTPLGWGAGSVGEGSRAGIPPLSGMELCSSELWHTGPWGEEKKGHCTGSLPLTQLDHKSILWGF